MEPSPIEVGHRIKEIRIKNGLSQREFAKRTNSTIPAISNWENGRNLPNKERLKAIAELGEISVDELLYGNIDRYIELVLKNDIKNTGRLFETIVQFLTHTTDLYTVEGAVFFDDNGKMLPIEDSPKMEHEIIVGTVLEYIEKHLNNYIIFIKPKLENSFNDSKVIEYAIAYTNIRYMYDMSTFEGQYFTYKKTMNDIIPNSVGFEDIESLTNQYMKMEKLSKEKAYKKAVDSSYQSKLYDSVSKFREEIDKLYLEYKNMIELENN